MTLIELKAAAYDAMVQVTAWQRKVAELEQQIQIAQATAPAGDPT